MFQKFMAVLLYTVNAVGLVTTAASGLPEIRAVQTIDVRDCAVGAERLQGFRVNDYAVTEVGVFAIVIPGRSVSPVLVHIDLGGKCLAALPLGIAVGANLTANNSGTVMISTAARVQGKGQKKIMVYDGPSMRWLRDSFPVEPITSFVLAGQSLFGVRGIDHTVVHLTEQTGTVSVDPAVNFNVSLRPLGVQLIAAGGETKLITFEEGSQRLTIIDLATSRSNAAVVSSPSLQLVLNQIPSALRPSQLQSVPGSNVLERSVVGLGATDSGIVFMQLAKFDQKSGPIVLAIDPVGAERGEYVFSPPSGTSFVPSSPKLGYVQGKLYLLDVSAGLIGVYNVAGIN